jgi:hypothetical protein
MTTTALVRGEIGRSTEAADAAKTGSAPIAHNDPASVPSVTRAAFRFHGLEALQNWTDRLLRNPDNLSATDAQAVGA